MLCADLVGWGDNLLGFRPFSILGNVIIFNNMISALFLSPLILIGVYPRVRAGRMLYSDVMPELQDATALDQFRGPRPPVAGRGRRVDGRQSDLDRLLDSRVPPRELRAAALR